MRQQQQLQVEGRFNPNSDPCLMVPASIAYVTTGSPYICAGVLLCSTSIDTTTKKVGFRYNARLVRWHIPALQGNRYRCTYTTTTTNHPAVQQDCRLLTDVQQNRRS